MKCPFCGFEIDDDSIFCDQCGKEIFICSKCGKPGKGKICTSCGNPLVSMKSKTVVTPHRKEIPSAVKSEGGKKVVGMIGAGELHLINKNLGVDLKIDKNVLIGRTEGDFINTFGKYKQVSGKHLEIKFDPNAGWTVTDLDSTNGAKYNNNKLTPFQPQVLSDKSFLCIANLEFYVQILDKLPKRRTGTERI